MPPLPSRLAVIPLDAANRLKNAVESHLHGTKETPLFSGVETAPF